jgi:hypothetical protein
MAEQAATLRQAAEPDPGFTRRLGETLTAHIRWEERELFPAIEQGATPAQLALLKDHTDRIEQQRTRNAGRPGHDPQ